MGYSFKNKITIYLAKYESYNFLLDQIGFGGLAFPLTLGRGRSGRYRSHRQVHPGQICARSSGLSGRPGGFAADPHRGHPGLFGSGICLSPNSICPGDRRCPGGSLGSVPSRPSGGGNQQSGGLSLRLSYFSSFWAHSSFWGRLLPLKDYAGGALLVWSAVVISYRPTQIGTCDHSLLL